MGTEFNPPLVLDGVSPDILKTQTLLSGILLKLPRYDLLGKIVVNECDHYKLVVDVTAAVVNPKGSPVDLTFDVHALRIVPELDWSCMQTFLRKVHFPPEGGTERLVFLFPFTPAKEASVDPSKHVYQVRIDEGHVITEWSESNNVLSLNTL